MTAAYLLEVPLRDRPPEKRLHVCLVHLQHLVRILDRILEVSEVQTAEGHVAVAGDLRESRLR